MFQTIINSRNKFILFAIISPVTVILCQVSLFSTSPNLFDSPVVTCTILTKYPYSLELFAKYN